MRQRKIFLYIIPYALLSSAAAICFTPSLFASFAFGHVQGIAETVLRWAGLLCTCAAALVLMVYAAHAAKNPMEKLPFPTACRRPFPCSFVSPRQRCFLRVSASAS